MLRLFVATHAPCLLPERAADFGVIGLGGFRPATTLPTVTDDTGDSIAAKNKHYSELTGHYWLWKNAPDLAVVGVCHYRRYFLFNPRVAAAKVRVPWTAANLAELTRPECGEFVRAALGTADVIVPRQQDLGSSLRAQYVDCHRREYWDLFLQAIDENLPRVACERRVVRSIDPRAPVQHAGRAETVLRRVPVPALRGDRLDGAADPFPARSVPVPGAGVRRRAVLLALPPCDSREVLRGPGRDLGRAVVLNLQRAHAREAPACIRAGVASWMQPIGCNPMQPAMQPDASGTATK
jgi:Domain of unknown function (DUF4422)